MGAVHHDENILTNSREHIKCNTEFFDEKIEIRGHKAPECGAG